jgi:hypothetical protein
MDRDKWFVFSWALVLIMCLVVIILVEMQLSDLRKQTRILEIEVLKLQMESEQ